MNAVRGRGGEAFASGFSEGVQAVLACIEARIQFWKAKRERHDYPVGVIETELRRLEKSIREYGAS